MNSTLQVLKEIRGAGDVTLTQLATLHKERGNAGEDKEAFFDRLMSDAIQVRSFSNDYVELASKYTVEEWAIHVQAESDALKRIITVIRELETPA